MKGGADSWGSWQRHMVLYLHRLCIKCSPMPASLTCSCPFPADTGKCSAPVVLIQEYGAGFASLARGNSLLGFVLLKKKKKKILWALLLWFPQIWIRWWHSRDVAHSGTAVSQAGRSWGHHGAAPAATAGGTRMERPPGRAERPPDKSRVSPPG